MPRTEPEKISNRANRIIAVIKPRKKVVRWTFMVEDDLEYPLIARCVTKFGTSYFIVAYEFFPYGFWIGRLVTTTDEDGTEVEEIEPIDRAGQNKWQLFQSLRFPSGDEYIFANRRSKRHHIDEILDRL